MQKHHALTHNVVSVFYIWQVSHYREKADTCQSDLAAEKIKTSTLQEEVCVLGRMERLKKAAILYRAV